jgi:hypothetical protein
VKDKIIVMKRAIFVPILFILLLVPCSAQDKTFDESVLSDRGKLVYRALLELKLFEIGPVGFSVESNNRISSNDRISEAEKLFRALLEEEEAVLAFKSLVKNATIEGGMFGLLGLKVTGCNCFEQEFADFKKSRTSEDNKEMFSIRTGCVLIGAKTKSHKEAAIDHIISEYFDYFTNQKKGLIEEPKKLKKQKPN